MPMHCSTCASLSGLRLLKLIDNKEIELYRRLADRVPSSKYARLKKNRDALEVSSLVSQSSILR